VLSMIEEPDKKDDSPSDGGKVTADAGPVVLTKPENRCAKKEEHEAAERGHWAHEKWVNKVTLGITAIALIAAGFSAYISNQALRAAIKAANEASRQAEASIKQSILDHPARLSIQNVVIWPHDRAEREPIDLRPGAIIDGLFPLINVGRDTAIITGMWCEAKWIEGELPMYRSFFEKNSKERCGDFGSNPRGFVPEIVPRHGILKEPLILQPGYGAVWEFQTTVPEQYTAELRLWVWGAIQYKDGVTEHSYVFARRYDPGKRQFIPETNPDYEGTEEPKR
jgi:hypothetical protein